MKVKWYKKVRVQLSFWLLLIYMLSSIIFVNILYQFLERYWVNQKITEITRYTNFVAGDISLGQLQMDLKGEGTEEAVENFSRLYGEARIIVLNEKAVVMQDSSQTKIGRTIVNGDVLKALSGERQGQGWRLYSDCGPHHTVRFNKVTGIVYVFFTIDKLLLSLGSNRGMIIYLMLLVGVIACILGMFIIMYYTEPLSSIQAWLHRMEGGHMEEQVDLHRRDDYGAIVESIQGITHDLMEVDASRQEFVSNVSHELKTPLSSIKVLTESLLLQDSVPEEMYKEFLQDINSEIDRQSAIVNDLLTLVRLEESEKSLNIKKFSLNELAEDILKRLKPLADRRNIELLLDTARDVTIEADEMKLTMALSNLIENGIKYNVENGSVTVTVDSDHRDAKITVSDTGIGIDESHFSKLFHRFYRVDKARDRGAGGTGLGLAIVRQIILLHKGTIGVKSKVGEGTSFIVMLPLQQVMSQEATG
ncbi:MAG: ATP-binding protein [Clostridia bacterium]